MNTIRENSVKRKLVLREIGKNSVMSEIGKNSAKRNSVGMGASVHEDVWCIWVLP